MKIFPSAHSREPIFARGLKRETRDLLELLILGAGDIEHRTRTGAKRFPNVPGASLGLGRAIDSMLDYGPNEEVQMEHRRDRDEDQSKVTDAIHDASDDDDTDNDDDVHL